MRGFLLFLLLCASPLTADKYTGPRPEKPDVPYLVHADNLVRTESTEARQESHKSDILYVVAGEHSPSRTPLSSPVFLIQTDQLQADKLQLYKLDSKGGQRQILFRKNHVPPHFRLNVTQLDDNLYRLEVDEILENGEYSLTPDGSNQVFCFQIY